MVEAASAGSLASAKLYARSGSSAIAVPIAITANPNQIQFTSGLTTICRLADWSCRSKAGITM